MSSNFKTPLSVYVLYDKDNTKGSETYEKIYHLLCRNSSRPFEDGLDIPVFFRTDMANQITPIDINFSNKTIAILLVDDNMYCNTIWDEYIKELLVKQDNGALKIFAVKLSKYAFDINPLLQEEQFICLKNENIETDWHEFQIRLYDNILRYLKSYKVGQKLKLFISHSKKDKDHLGESTAISLRDYLRSDTKLDSFFDVNDILDGHQFAQQIQSGIASSLLVIIESDTYSEREWCRIEATFDRNTFFVEGISGLKYRCGLSGALPLGFVESAQYPHGALSKLPSLIEKQQKAVERIESEIPTLQKIVCRQWSKTDELSRFKQECKELQHRIDESLKEAEQPQAAKHEAIAEAA